MSYVVIHGPCCLYTKRVASERLCYDKTDIYGIMSASMVVRVKDGPGRRVTKHHVARTKSSSSGRTKRGRERISEHGKRKVGAMAEPLAGNRSTGFSFRFLRALGNAFIYGTKRLERGRVPRYTFTEPSRNSSKRGTRTSTSHSYVPNVEENTRAATSKIPSREENSEGFEGKKGKIGRVMALVAWSRYTTVRHSTIETSGPSQEVRHTCSGVPIIRAPAPPVQRVPSSMAHTGSNHATDTLPFVRGKVKRRKKKVCKRHVHRASSQCTIRRRYEEHDDNNQRIGRMLVEVFRTAASNGTKLNVSEVMQAVRQIADDTDAQVGLDLMEHIPHVVTICHETPHLFDNIFHNHLLDLIIRYLQDQDNQVRMMAQTAVLTLTKKGLIDNTTIEGKLCPVIETLCTSVDLLNSGISLMCKMAPLIGKELTEKIFLDRYITLCEDKEFYTRKFCASHLGELCAAVGRKTLFRKLFPIFVDLCSDKIWGVRKACVDVMMPVSCCMTLQHRRLLLAELLATHLNDESKWVRMSAFQILGPFISTFAKQFTEVTYNQHGELVFTSPQDNRFSIRYSYEGIFPTKCAIRSHTLDMEDHNSKDNFNAVIIQKPIFEDDEDESQEDDISTMRAYKSKIQRKHLKNDEALDDTENFNSFLYYYIEPDLPLDDELVEAAKRSAAQNNVDRKPLISTTASSKASSLDAVLKEDRYAADDIKNFNDQGIVPQHLIDSFLSMAEPEQCSGDMSPGDIPHHCAFSFPAVVLTLGKENWPHLKQAYQSLASANQWKVRRTLASSIHEIAIILGEELTIADLVPIYDGFIKDLDEVRIGILKHLATFLKILKPTVRIQYLPRLKEFLTTDNEWNWRFREELATQLLDIVNLFDPIDVDRFIVPLALDLLRDKYAAVRHVALSLMTQIVAHLSDNRRLVKALFRKLKSLVYARKWIRRQTFAFVCANLISNNAISGDRFSQEMLPTLLEISSDRVPNVRLVVARTLSKNVIPMGSEWLGVKQAEEVENRLREMRSDPDRDVRVLAGGEENAALDILSQTKAEQSRNIMF